MANGGGKPDITWGQLQASTDFRELFRYRKGEETRTYALVVVESGAELWRLTSDGEESRSLKEDDFSNADEAIRTLSELETRLHAGRWQKVSD
jgi:hypothetical protein